MSGERPRDRNTLLHAARQLPRHVFGKVAKFDKFKHFGCSRPPARPIPAGEFKRKFDIALNIAPLK